jgi:pimeloyl-ACP methyl ester carboxylesterase
MPTVTDGPVELWFEASGEGPPLVLTGGFGLLEEQFHAVRPHLVDRFRVIDWNYRGSGRSTRDCEIGFDRWVEDLDLVMDAAQVDTNEAILWGTSTGSPIALAYASRHPERVRAIAVHPFVDARGGRRVFEGFRAVGESFGYEALALLTAWIGCSGEAAMETDMLELALFEAAAFERMISLDRLGEILGVLGEVDLGDELAAWTRLEVPTLVLIGETGRMGIETKGTRKATDAFRELVPHAELATVPAGGGTYCMIEQPTATANALTSWINALPV